MKSDLQIILFFLLAFVMVSLNELGYGIFALFLLFPAYLLMEKAFGNKESRDQAGNLILGTTFIEYAICAQRSQSISVDPPHLAQPKVYRIYPLLMGYFLLSRFTIMLAMGRTLPSTTQIVFGLISELEPFYGAVGRFRQRCRLEGIDFGL